MPEKGDPWTTSEIRRLKQLYPITPRRELPLHFPGRTFGTIISRAVKLKIKKRTVASLVEEIEVLHQELEALHIQLGKEALRDSKPPSQKPLVGIQADLFPKESSE